MIRVQGMGLAAAVVGTLIVGSVGLSNSAFAASPKEIDTGVDEAMVMFEKEVKDGKSFLVNSKGVLVFPSVIKAGLGVGGEYGEGAHLGSPGRQRITTVRRPVRLACKPGTGQDRLCGDSAGRCSEKVSRKRRMEGGWSTAPSPWSPWELGVPSIQRR